MCQGAAILVWAFLGGHPGVDAFVKGPTRWMDREFLFILFEESKVVLGQSRNLVNVLDRGVRTMTGNLSSSRRKHPTKLLVIALVSSSIEEDEQAP